MSSYKCAEYNKRGTHEDKNASDESTVAECNKYRKLEETTANCSRRVAEDTLEEKVCDISAKILKLSSITYPPTDYYLEYSETANECKSATLKHCSDFCSLRADNGLKQFKPDDPEIIDEHDPRFVLLKKITKAGSPFEQVTVLKLADCFLNHIPDDIHVLPLCNLDVSGNLLSEIPNCLYLGLSQLDNLNLSNNKLKEFERVPSCKTDLKTLDLSKNRFLHPPSWIQKSVLMELHYNHNRLVKLKKETTINLSLNHLEIQNCLFSNKNLHYLLQFGKLEHLDLNNSSRINLNNFDKLDELFKMLNFQAYLQVLLLEGLTIPEVPNTIKNLSNLRELNLSSNNLDKLPGSLVELKKLRVLKLAHNQLFELPHDFNRLGDLEVLEAQYNFISSVDLRGMHHLKCVDLYHNDLNDARLENSVEMIDLDDNYVDGLEVCENYAQKRDLLRGTSEIYSTRLVGCNIASNFDEDFSGESDDSRSKPILEPDCILSSGNVVVSEEEYWDTCSDSERPDGVTLSDSEYQGDDSPEQESIPSNPSDSDSVCDYLYEDAD